MMHPQVKREFFTQLPNKLIDSDLSANAFKGFVRMLRDRDIMNKEKFSGSVRKLANRIKMPHMTVSRMVAEWEKAELVYKEVQQKADENREEMVLYLLIDSLWRKNSEVSRQECTNLGQCSYESVPIWDNDVPEHDGSVPARYSNAPFWYSAVPTASVNETTNTIDNTSKNTSKNTKRESEPHNELALSGKTSSSQSSVVVENASQTPTSENVAVDNARHPGGVSPSRSQERDALPSTASTMTTGNTTIPIASSCTPAPMAKEKDEEKQAVKAAPVMPSADAKWGTRTCMQMFDAWRGAHLLAKYKLQQASSTCKALAENYTREQIEQVYESMSNEPFWQDKGGPDFDNVANNIAREIKKLERSHLHVMPGQKPPVNQYTARSLDKDHNAQQFEKMKKALAEKQAASK